MILSAILSTATAPDRLSRRPRIQRSTTGTAILVRVLACHLASVVFIRVLDQINGHRKATGPHGSH